MLNHLVLSYQLDYQKQCSRHLNVYRCRLYGKVFWSSPGSFLYSDQKLASGIDEAKKVVKLSICTRSGWPPWKGFRVNKRVANFPLTKVLYCKAEWCATLRLWQSFFDEDGSFSFVLIIMDESWGVQNNVLPWLLKILWEANGFWKGRPSFVTEKNNCRLTRYYKVRGF